MVDAFRPTAASPLDGLSPLAGLVALSEKTGLGAFNLRGTGDAFLAAAEHALGLRLPADPGTTSGADEVRALWLGPDEWLLEAPLGRMEGLETALRAALDGQHAALTEVSDQTVVLGLTGPQAREVLARGCPLDLHERAFGPERCAQSHYVKAAILLHQSDDRPSFEIRVRRSLARYLWTALAEAAGEFD